jgi:hypothetical protein
VSPVGSMGAFATPRASLTECNLCYIRSELVASSASRSAAAEPATGLGAAASTRPRQAAPTRRDERSDNVFTPIHANLARCKKEKFEGEVCRLGRWTRTAAAPAVATSSRRCATLPPGMSRRLRAGPRTNGHMSEQVLAVACGSDPQEHLRQAAAHRGRQRAAAHTLRLPLPRRAWSRRRALLGKMRRPAKGELVTSLTCSPRGDRLGLAEAEGEAAAGRAVPTETRLSLHPWANGRGG